MGGYSCLSGIQYSTSCWPMACQNTVPFTRPDNNQFYQAIAATNSGDPEVAREMALVRGVIRGSAGNWTYYPDGYEICFWGDSPATPPPDYTGGDTYQPEVIRVKFVAYPVAPEQQITEYQGTSAASVDNLEPARNWTPPEDPIPQPTAAPIT
jgi:hypothetical protein